MVQAPSFAVRCPQPTRYGLPEGAHARASTRYALPHDISMHGSQPRHRVLTALFLGSDVCVVVTLHPVQELLPTLGVLDVLNAEVDALLDVPVADDLVNNDTDGVLCDVVDDASSPAISAFRHKIQQGNT